MPAALDASLDASVTEDAGQDTGPPATVAPVTAELMDAIHAGLQLSGPMLTLAVGLRDEFMADESLSLADVYELYRRRIEEEYARDSCVTIEPVSSSIATFELQFLDCPTWSGLSISGDVLFEANAVHGSWSWSGSWSVGAKTWFGVAELGVGGDCPRNDEHCVCDRCGETTQRWSLNVGPTGAAADDWRALARIDLRASRIELSEFEARANDGIELRSSEGRLGFLQGQCDPDGTIVYLDPDATNAELTFRGSGGVARVQPIEGGAEVVLLPLCAL